MSLSTEEITIAQTYDLTGEFFPYVERQLLYLLSETYELINDDQEDVNELKSELLKDTYLFQLIRESYAGKEIPAEIAQREKDVTVQLEQLTESTKEIIDKLNANKGKLTQDKNSNRQLLLSEGIKESQIDELFELGKLQYNRGDYTVSSDLLSNFKSLSNNHDLLLKATWGKLASDINNEEFDNANSEIIKLNEIIDNNLFQTLKPIDQLKFRCALIHYSLFVFFNTGNYSQLVDSFMSISNLAAIENGSPWVIRYIIISMFMTMDFKKLRDLIKAVNIESYEYQDPFTELFQILFTTLEFSKLNTVIEKVKILIKTDYFISKVDSELLMANINKLILTSILKVYSNLTIDKLAKIVKVDERYINENESISINPTTGVLSLNDNSIGGGDLYHQVYEKTKALNYKSTQMMSNAFN